MARRGRFGRRPRSSPDLTATIVSMAREYQCTRDRNLLNSWNEGGKFEGKQVTDQMLLDHLADRRNGLSKDDPLWDEMDQKLTEYTFAVDNSKMELKYAEGKASDGDMSRFYARAAQKLPQNSEAWRKMRTLAAQYKDRASSGGGGGGRGGGGNGYNSERNKIPLKKEVAYDKMVATLTDVALREGILQTTEEDLGDLRAFEGDATRLVQLIEVFNTDPKYADERDDLKTFVQRWGNPNFSGVVSWDTLAAEKVNKNQGLSHRIALAQKGGHATDTKKLTKELEESDGEYNTVTAAGPLAQYESARKQYDLETEAENVTPIEMYLAAQKFATKLGTIHDEVRAAAIATGDKRLSDMTGRLNNEYTSLVDAEKADVNAPTLWESSRGVVAGSLSSENGDTAKNVAGMRQLNGQMRLLTSGAGVIMRVDASGQMTDNPDPAVSHYAVVPKADVEEGAAWVPTAGSLPPSVTFEGKEYPTGGVMTAVIPQRVFADSSGPLDITGRATQSAAKPTANQNVANIFTMPDGTRLAQYWDTDGKKRWTNNPDALFGDGKLEQGRDGFHITIETPDVRKGTPAKEYDPFSALDPTFTDPDSANKMVNSVGLSSFAMWLNSNRTVDNDPGVAYAMDPNVARAAITAEVGTAKPLELAAALREADEARTDYLANTPDIQRRIRAVAQSGDPATVADKLGAQGYADVGGLNRDVQGFFDRLRNKTGGGGPAAGPNAVGDMAASQEQRERDELIRGALMEDPNLRMRIDAIEGGNAYLPSHIKDLARDQQTKALGPGFVTMEQWNKENMMVKNFKDLQQSQMAGWAGALASPGIAAAFRPTNGPMAGPAAAKMPKPPKTAAEVNAAATKAAKKADTLTAAEAERQRALKYKGKTSHPGMSGTHGGGSGPQEYN